jgi:hypothetical protein
MLANYGQEFTDYFFKFHIFDRAFIGVEHNTKGSGYLYHINYLLSILPFSILIFISLVKDFIKIKQIDFKKIFLIIWFLTGLAILLILAPGSLMLVEYLLKLNDSSTKEKLIVIGLTTLNILWSVSLIIRNNLYYKDILFHNILIASAMLVLSGIIIFFVIRFISNKITILNFYYLFIFLFCIGINTFFLFNIPEWENTYEISKVKSLIESSGRNEIIYISSNYRANPQLSFYFDGIDLGWRKSKYKFELLDTKNGNNKIKEKLNGLKENESNILVEKDNINRSEYTDAINFIPNNYKLIYKTRGYELYQN